MKLHKLSEPRDLPPREEALYIARQSSSRLIPDIWLNLLLDDPKDKPRALSREEARRVRHLAVLVNVRDSDMLEKEAMDELGRKFPMLRPRIAARRAELLAAELPPRSNLVAELTTTQIKAVGEQAKAAGPSLEAIAAKRAAYAALALNPARLYEAQINMSEAELEEADQPIEAAVSELLGPEFVGVNWMSFGFDPEFFDDLKTRARAKEFINNHELLFRRLRGEGLDKPVSIPPARRWWAMQSGVFLAGWRSEAISQDDLKLLRGLASFTLAQIRRELAGVAKGDADEAERCFGRWLKTYHLATHCLLIVDDLAFFLRQLLQLLRVCPKAVVDEDLSYWRDSRSDGLGRIGLNLINSVHGMATKSKEDDPKLRGVREDLALFCLGRLGQKKGEKCGDGLARTETMVERDPYWRACYMHAVDALRVNPDDKGHRALYWSMKHDPEAEVREVAKELYPRVERKRDIADGSSPRRPLITAVWWMLQAHRLSLGLDVDDTAIHATLAAMVRRTTESFPSTMTAEDNQNQETQPTN